MAAAGVCVCVGARCGGCLCGFVHVCACMCMRTRAHVLVCVCERDRERQSLVVGELCMTLCRRTPTRPRQVLK